MSEHPTINWIGASGQRYKYYIYGLPANFNPNQDGNYIYSKLNANNKWVPIYIGQGDLRKRAENHHQAACIARKGAINIHVHLSSKKEDRINEEKDLLANYTNAHQPIGCNKSPGG